MIDGLHPSPRFTDMLWIGLVRAVRRVISAPAHPQISAPPNPVPALAKLSVKDRLWRSTSDLAQTNFRSSKWKGTGKGKGKRHNIDISNPKNSASQHHPYSRVTPGVAVTSYEYPQQSGSGWNPPPYTGPQPSLYKTSSTPKPAPYRPPPPKKSHPQDKLLEETTDTYGNLSWRPLPAEPINQIGTINYSCPQKWDWDVHMSEVSKVQGRCSTNSVARQDLFREQAAAIIRERALDEMWKGLNSSANMAASTLAHRTTHQFSRPPPMYQHINEDLRDLMPPPSSGLPYYAYPPPNYAYPPP